jgi:Cu(I)/Ag(I) efflux system membrane protein CusA/SilA
MVGGLVTSFALELLVYPAIYMLWKQRSLPKPDPDAPVPSPEPSLIPA